MCESHLPYSTLRMPSRVMIKDWCVRCGEVLSDGEQEQG